MAEHSPLSKSTTAASTSTEAHPISQTQAQTPPPQPPPAASTEAVQASIPTSNPPKTYTYYHAGPLFTLAELHTNTLLSTTIHELSRGKYLPVVPQDLEQRDTHPHSIRDQDLRALLACDLALFTYDGAELDAGTVVEYMVAKMADIPSVIVRSDFRRAGDQSESGGDAWNLMSSFWPRTVGVTVDAMVGYKKSLVVGKGKPRVAGMMVVEAVAGLVVEAFEEVLKSPSRLPPELRESVYSWIALMPGLKDGDDRENVVDMLKLCRQKAGNGLL